MKTYITIWAIAVACLVVVTKILGLIIDTSQYATIEHIVGTTYGVLVCYLWMGK